MSRSSLLLSVIIFLSACNGTERQPNVIIILADDQGWGDLSINGNTSIKTSNLDRMAVSGVMFDRFYVSPVCSPTRAELLTGRYHTRSGVHGTSAGSERMNADETTLAEVFQEAGYVTGVFGKWHNGQQPPYHPNSRGFDHFYGFASGHWGHYFSPPLELNNELVQGEGYLPDDLTQAAMTFITENRASPFLVFLPYNTPHSPMQVPDQWWDSVPGRFQYHPNAEREDTLHTRAALAMTLNIDWNVGRLLALLDELSLSEDTIVLYFSDNGPNGARWNAGMKGRKGSTDEGGVRSPLLMQWKGTLAANTAITEIAAAIDLMPTLTELTGIELNTRHPLDGVSLAPLLTGSAEALPERMIFSHWNGRTSIRTQTHRLDHTGQLFNMVEDPEQRQNIAPEHPELADSLRRAREAWIDAAVPDTFENRPFTVGHPDYEVTWLPARDAVGSGGILRSNRYPNDSFLMNWTHADDAILWDVEVLTAGNYMATLYYTAASGDEGAQITLDFGESAVGARITEAHDPPEYGMDEDRVLRIESYVKDFRPLLLGQIFLEAGRKPLSLRATSIPGTAVADVRLLQLERTTE